MYADTHLLITIPSSSAWKAPDVGVTNKLLKCASGCRKLISNDDADKLEWMSQEIPASETLEVAFSEETGGSTNYVLQAYSNLPDYGTIKIYSEADTGITEFSKILIIGLYSYSPGSSEQKVCDEGSTY